MPMFKFPIFMHTLPDAQAISLPSRYVLMAILSFLLGICITLLLHLLHRFKALTPPEEDSHEL